MFVRWKVQGAMLSVQIDKLPQFNACRRDNLKRIREVMLRDDRFLRFMSLMEASPGVDPAWFGVGALLNRPYAHQRREFLTYLEKNGIENRPIISGNFIRQPCIAAFCERERPENYPGAEAIHTPWLLLWYPSASPRSSCDRETVRDYFSPFLFIRSIPGRCSNGEMALKWS